MPAAPAVRDRGVLRVVGAALRAATVLAAVVLLAGCLGTGTSGTGGTGTGGTPGTGDSDGNGYGGQGGSADGGQGDPGGAGGTGGDGGDGYGGWGGNGYGGNGYGGNGGSADGGDGAPGVNGADGVDGAPGSSYSGTGSVVGSGRLTSRLICLSGVNSAPAGPALHLVATGTSEVTGPIRVDRLQANASGAATLLLSGQARDLHLSGAGTSRLQLADLTVRNLDVVLSGDQPRHRDGQRHSGRAERHPQADLRGLIDRPGFTVSKCPTIRRDRSESIDTRRSRAECHHLSTRCYGVEIKPTLTSISSSLTYRPWRSRHS